MIKPSILMLDEPTAGVSPIVMDELFQHIIKVKEIMENAIEGLKVPSKVDCAIGGSWGQAKE